MVPEAFFHMTYISRSMMNVFENVLNALERGCGKVIELSGVSGGGKTHTLLAIYHAFRKPEALRLASPRDVADRLANRIKEFKENYGEVTIVVIDGEFKALAPSPATPLTVGTYKVRTIWGFIAHQLNKYEFLKDSDQTLRPPTIDELKEIFSAKPVIILIDNFAEYLLRATRESFLEPLLNFIKRLPTGVSGKSVCVLMVHDTIVHEPGIVWRTIEFVPPLPSTA